MQNVDAEKLDPVFLDMHPSREEMKKKLNIDAQQIQRYEKTNYSSVSLERAIDILKALDIDLKGRIALQARK
jgi:transcriptional regulator with XRE-family HTH domain